MIAAIALAGAIAAITIGQAAQGEKIGASQKRSVALRGHLTDSGAKHRVITWQTSNPDSSGRPQAHLAIETLEPKPQILWQADGGASFHKVDSIRLADLDADGVLEIMSLWWKDEREGARLRIFHWDRDKRSFVELEAEDGIEMYGIKGYRIASDKGTARKRLVFADGEYELRDSKIVRAGGKMNEAKQGESGMEGIVTISPTKPGPIREGEIDIAPYQTTLLILTEGEGREVVRLETGKDGRFRISLPPGKYRIKPVQLSRRLPYAEEQVITVLPGRFVQVKVAFDSGMR